MPTRAAFEGFRLLRREPAAAVVWTLLWLAVILFTAIIVATGDPVVLQSHRARDLRSFGARFGPFALLSTVLFLLVWATTTVAVYRAVLRPHDRRAFFLRLGADELRLAIMTIASFVLILIFGGVPAYLLFVLLTPLMRALPALEVDIATIGAGVTVIVDMWLGVRLSLIAVETFAERRFHLTAYWPLARGHSLYLFVCYVLCFFIVFALSLLIFTVGGLVTTLAQNGVGAGSLLQRGTVMGLAGVLAVLTAGFFLLSTTVFCACQAYAFREIVNEGKSGVAIS